MTPQPQSHWREEGGTPKGLPSQPHFPSPFGWADATEVIRLCALRPVCFLLLFFLIYIPAFAEITGFDPLSVQGTGVGIGYNHLRWLAVTHHPFPFRYPYHPASGRAFMHSLVGTSYVRRGGEQAKGSRGNWAVTDRVQFLVSTANQALCPVCEQGPRPTRIPCCCA